MFIDGKRVSNHKMIDWRTFIKLQEAINSKKNRSREPRIHRNSRVRSILLGFDANNKKIILCNSKLAKDLSTSNVVMVNRSLEAYPHRPNMGITLPHKR
jgi:hypothetical protein